MLWVAAVQLLYFVREKDDANKTTGLPPLCTTCILCCPVYNSPLVPLCRLHFSISHSHSYFQSDPFLQFQTAFQSSGLILVGLGCQGVRVLGCQGVRVLGLGQGYCQGNGAFAYIIMYKILTNRIRAFKKVFGVAHSFFGVARDCARLPHTWQIFDLKVKKKLDIAVITQDAIK